MSPLMPQGSDLLPSDSHSPTLIQDSPTRHVPATSFTNIEAPEVPPNQPLPEVVSVRDPSHRTSAVVLSLSHLPAASEFAAATEIDDELLNGPITPRLIPGRTPALAELKGSESGPQELDGSSRVQDSGEAGDPKVEGEREPVEAP